MWRDDLRRWISRTSRIFCGLAGGAALAQLTVACGPEECTQGAFECRDHWARNCRQSSHEDERLTWGQEYCNFGCVDDGQRPYCAATPDADAKCGQAPTGPGICLDTTATSCVSGFPIRGGTDCTLASKVCAEQDSKVFCALSLEPDPRCADAAAETWAGCADGALLDCRFGLATHVEPCPAGSVCRATAAGRATCETN